MIGSCSRSVSGTVSRVWASLAAPEGVRGSVDVHGQRLSVSWGGSCGPKGREMLVSFEGSSWLLRRSI